MTPIDVMPTRLEIRAQERSSLLGTPTKIRRGSPAVDLSNPGALHVIEAQVERSRQREAYTHERVNQLEASQDLRDAKLENLFSNVIQMQTDVAATRRILNRPSLPRRVYQWIRDPSNYDAISQRCRSGTTYLRDTGLARRICIVVLAILAFFMSVWNMANQVRQGAASAYL